MLSVLVVSGPNLDRLGRREPHIYGTQTLADIHVLLEQRAQELSAQGIGVRVQCRQSNHEGVLIDWIGAASDDGFHAVVLNPGAYTHTSWALHDCIKAAMIPVVECHLSNPSAREAFRHHSCVAPACVGTIAGFGAQSYLIALRAIVERLHQA
jgi:3-dehydroquinate dehydratase II